jgi:hypothetical protein
MPANTSENPSPFGSKAVSKLATERLQEISNCAKLAKMPLQEGAMIWLQSRKPFIGARTAKDYERYISIIVGFFGNVRLEKLANADLIRAYQLERTKTCGASTVNKECSLIQQLLKRIRKWNEVSSFYEPLPMPRQSVGRSMTPEEERKLFATGALMPSWATVYRLAVISNEHGSRSSGTSWSSAAGCIGGESRNGAHFYS